MYLAKISFLMGIKQDLVQFWCFPTPRFCTANAATRYSPQAPCEFRTTRWSRKANFFENAADGRRGYFCGVKHGHFDSGHLWAWGNNASRRLGAPQWCRRDSIGEFCCHSRVSPIWQSTPYTLAAIHHRLDALSGPAFGGCDHGVGIGGLLVE